jgi:hypothetical protein
LLRYELLFTTNDSIKLFKLFDDSERLIKAYFCFLIFTYDEICDYLETHSLDINDPVNQKKTDLFDLNLIIENFENAIKMINDDVFIRILQNLNTNSDSSKWHFLINKLKLRHIKEDDFQLPNEFLLDDDDN